MCHLQVHGKGSKIRYLPLHPAAADANAAYFKATGHGDGKPGPLFRLVINNTRDARDHARRRLQCPDQVCRRRRRRRHRRRRFRASRAARHGPTNAIEHDANIAKVQHDWGTSISRPHACTTATRCAPGIVRRLKSCTEVSN